MARTRLIAVIAIVAMLLSIAVVVYAQGGPGRGRGMGAGRMGQGGQNRNGQGGMQGGWWTRVKAQTPEQQAFIDQVAKLHEQIRAKQFELGTLQASNASQADIAAAQSQLNALRSQLMTLMSKNGGLCKGLGVTGCPRCGEVHPGQYCPFGCGMGMGQGMGRGMGMGMGQGGWWNMVQPQTPEEKAFVDQVKSLHDQIVAAQAAGDQAKAGALRSQLHDVMLKNQALHQQMMMSNAGPKGRGMGRGK